MIDMNRGIYMIRGLLLVILCIFSLSMFLVDPAFGEIAGPGWLTGNAPQVTHKEAEAYYAAKRNELASNISKPAVVATAVDSSPEIVELARALRYDPKLIFDYVHNNIDYVPYFGSLKGATLTYLDGSGNDYDQASLMIALLKESSIYNATVEASSIQYVFGRTTMSGDMVANWLGVDNVEADTSPITKVLSSGGIPFEVSYKSQQVVIYRVVVQATINGKTCMFDPAFKSYEYKNKIDLGLAMDYNQSDLIAAATGEKTEITADYAQNINETGLGNKLAAYASNLVDIIRSQYPNKDVKEIIGGRSIVQTYLTDCHSSAAWFTIGSSRKDIPSIFVATLQIQHMGINHSFNIHNLSGKRLAISYAGKNNRPELRLDGQLIASGTATKLSSKYNLTITVKHPYAAFKGTYADQKSTYSIQSGGNYAIVYDFGGISDMRIQKQQLQVDSYRAQGLADTSELVLGGTLNIMGLTWFKELNMSNRLISALNDTIDVSHHRVGLMAQEAGYYIDVGTSFSSLSSRHNIDADLPSHVKALALILSAFEHGMLEQLMGKPAVSTMKLFQIANSTGRKIFYANKANFAKKVKPQLTNYSKNDLENFQKKIDKGRTLILPDNGMLESGEWKGNGFLDYYFKPNSFSMFMIIGGKHFGGYGSYPEQVSYPTVTNNTVPPITPNTVSLQVSPTTNPTYSIDPVDMASGAFVYDHTDIAIGTSEPQGLSFSRSYDSRLNYEKKMLGNGWTHNYDIYLTTSSHADPGLGSRQPIDAASLITALYINLDLMKTQDNIQGWMTASLTTKWAVDQLINNAVTVHTGKKVTEYIKLADGTYAAPPGSTTQLIKNGNTYSLKERFGTVTDFVNLGTPDKPDFRIEKMTDLDGNILSFAYIGNLNQVKDAFSRTLTLHYDASNRIETVTDDSTGRFVKYGYDANNDLTVYTDPENKTWGYGYDESHRMKTLTNPLNITTATNVYDSLGRVKTQTVPRQNGVSATSNFYFSGYRNVEEGPTGNTLTYYYDSKGREYAFENALGHRVTKEFDGQNHVTKVIDPRTNVTSFEYDGLQNLKTITNALEKKTQYIYDSHLRQTDTVDPLFHGSHVDYDDKHHPDVTRSGLSYNADLSPLDNGLYGTGATYYPNGLPWTITDDMKTTTTLTYDSYGNPWTSTTGMHPAVTTVYNSIGWLGSLTDQVNTTTDFNQYNNRGQLILKTDPLGKPTSFTYYDDGSLWTKTDRKKNTLTYTYTPFGKLDNVTYPDTSQVKFYYYDKLDNLWKMQDALGDTTYYYYADNSLKTVTDPNGFEVAYEYDPAGNLTKLTYPGNKNVIYTYTKLNQLETVKIGWLNQTAKYLYDDAGRLDTLTNFNGTVTKYGFDNANRLASLDHKKSDASVLASYHFPVLDGNGNRKQIIQNEPLAPSQVAEGETSYAYNDKNNRLQSVEASSFGYDDEGQLNSAYGNSYVFDYEHRLVTAGTDQYFYDGSGKRLKAVRNGITTKYIYDASGNLLAEVNGDNVITKYYIHGAGLMAMVTPAGDIYPYHFNATGSTVAMTDQRQNMVNKYSYDSFGEVLGQTETIPQPFKFIGQFGVMAEPNGLYYMRARYYNPEVGRFISEDPSGFEGGDVNLYSYASGNPITWIDPSGLCSSQSNLQSTPFLQQLLTNTADYNQIAAYAATTAKIAPLALTYQAISVAASTLNNIIYSDHPFVETAKETFKIALGKMADEIHIGVNMFVDWLANRKFNNLINFMDKGNNSGKIKAN